MDACIYEVPILGEKKFVGECDWCFERASTQVLSDGSKVLQVPNAECVQRLSATRLQLLAGVEWTKLTSNVLN